jgi:uncharacterized membrane protein YjfL (UPF0719 family)
VNYVKLYTEKPVFYVLGIYIFLDSTHFFSVMPKLHKNNVKYAFVFSPQFLDCMFKFSINLHVASVLSMFNWNSCCVVVMYTYYFMAARLCRQSRAVH